MFGGSTQCRNLWTHLMSWVGRTAVKSIQWVRSIPITLTSQPIIALTIIYHIPQMSCKTRALRMTEMFVSWASRFQPYDSDKRGTWSAGVNEQLQQAGADAFNRFQRCARVAMILLYPIVSISCRLFDTSRSVDDLDKEVLYPILSLFTFLAFHSCSHDRNVPFISCGLASTRPDNLGAPSLSWPPCSNSAIVWPKCLFFSERTPQICTHGRSCVYSGNLWWAGASFRGEGSPDSEPRKHVEDGAWSLTNLTLKISRNSSSCSRRICLHFLTASMSSRSLQTKPLMLLSSHLKTTSRWDHCLIAMSIRAEAMSSIGPLA